jgi:calcineurin-like phosphoesterase family protein
MQYFTADPHFGHKSVIDFCNRPFSSGIEMDSVLINNINKKVLGGDTLYILGDFSFRSSPRQILEYRNRIWCNNIVLVLGNHDKEIRKNEKLRRCFSEVVEFGTEISLGGRRIVLCHYPLETWAGQRKGAIHLHGHSHGNLSREVVSKPNRMDVGVDCHSYMPISLDEILVLCENNNKENNG